MIFLSDTEFLRSSSSFRLATVSFIYLDQAV